MPCNGEGVLTGRTDLARSFIGVAVRSGAPHPDIGTPDAFVATLLAASSVAMSQAGASGLYMAGLLERLGIADAVRRKATILSSGFTAELAASGAVELAIQQVSELLVVPGIELVGRLPQALGGETVFSAGLFIGAPLEATGRALIAALASPERDILYRALRSRTSWQPTAEPGIVLGNGAPRGAHGRERCRRRCCRRSAARLALVAATGHMAGPAVRLQAVPGRALPVPGGGAAGGVPHLSARPRRFPRLHRHAHRAARRVGRPRQFRQSLARPSVLAQRHQHAVLHGGGDGREVRAGTLARAAAQPEYPVQVADPRDRAGAVDRADRAVGDRVLVDLRPAILDHLLCAQAMGADPAPISTSSARPGTRGSA